MHLHVHSPYSFLDGASGITKLVERAADLGMPALALTDHNRLSGTVRFIKTAQNAGIKPIIGCEVTAEGGFHLTLLCKNNTGYRNLCAVLTRAHLENERGFPVTDMHTLASHKEGLFVLSGCRKGLIPSLILQKGVKKPGERQNITSTFWAGFVLPNSQNPCFRSMSLTKPFRVGGIPGFAHRGYE